MNGYWGEPRSNIDWCELNYIHNYYIAEWYNSLSNLVPICILLYYLKKVWNMDYPYTIKLSYCIFIIVYTGSFIFHVSLTYWGQLMDEIPMLYGCIYFHYILHKHKKYIKLFCIKCIIVSTILMIYFNNNPILSLQIPYGLLNISIIIYNIILYKKIKKYNYLLKYSAILYITGFICWLLDRIYCHYTREYYLHAWWHILTGLGSIYWVQFLYINELKSNDFTLSKNLYILPFYYKQIKQ